MNPVNSKNPLDNPNGSVENKFINETNTKKTPWFLRWPGAILLKSDLLASNTISFVSATLHPLRQRAQSMELAQENRPSHRYRHCHRRFLL